MLVHFWIPICNWLQPKTEGPTDDGKNQYVNLSVPSLQCSEDKAVTDLLKTGEKRSAFPVTCV